MSKVTLIREFFEYVTKNNKLWLIPLLIIFALFAIAALVAQSPALAPFIYSLF
jgi:hypothetical protein